MRGSGRDQQKLAAVQREHAVLLKLIGRAAVDQEDEFQPLMRVPRDALRTAGADAADDCHQREANLSAADLLMVVCRAGHVV